MDKGIPILKVPAATAKVLARFYNARHALPIRNRCGPYRRNARGVSAPCLSPARDSPSGRVVAFALAVILSWTAAACPTMATALIGVNQTGLGWMTAVQRKAIIDNMHQNGVQFVRIPLHEPYGVVIDTVADMHARGIGVVLVVSLNQKRYFAPSVAMRPGFGRVETSYPLSQIDPSRFRDTFGAVWEELERRRLSLLAVQVGNEINWTFNGDLPVSPVKGIGAVRTDPQQQPWGAAFEQGLDRYVDIARVVKSLRDGSQANHGAKVIAAGLARIRSSFAAAMGAQSVDPVTTLQMLAARGLDSVIDGRAIHLYPQPSELPEERQKALDTALSDCVVDSTTEGCWLTEWGFNNFSRSCPDDDAVRRKLVEETRWAIDQAAAKGRLASAFYFEWEGKSPRSVWRCGRLSPAGQIAVSTSVP